MRPHRRLHRSLLSCLPRWARACLPLRRVHHIFESYGVVLAWWPGRRKPFRRCGKTPARGRWTWVRRRDYHDCTATGVY